MILSDRDIKKRLDKGDLVIEPIEDRELQIQPASVDLRLGNEFKTFRKTLESYIDPFDKCSIQRYYSEGDIKNPTLDFFQKEKPVSPDDLNHEVLEYDAQYIIRPQDFLLGTTLEYVKIPDDLVGRLEGRSSLGRLGIVIHSTAGFIDPGFEGTITLEIGNLGIMPVALYTKMRVCQIVFEQLSSPAEKPYGPIRGSKYQGQKGPIACRLGKDSEMEKLTSKFNHTNGANRQRRKNTKVIKKGQIK